MAKTFTIYRSSAGSGKTRTLAREYLKLALRLRSHYFKHILAVTFTNKATQEMKDRILAYLDEFANGRPGDLATELKEGLGLDDSTFQQYAQEAQSAVLHSYSEFSISTIDAFFQKVIRSFTREAGLVGDYRLEIDQDTVLEDVIDNLIDELGSNKELTDWVVEFARDNLENEKAWDVRHSLMEFSHEIFREEFKFIEDDIVTHTAKSGYFQDLRQSLWKVKRHFLNQVNKPAAEMLRIMESQPWDFGDLFYGRNSGLSTFLHNFAYGKNVKDMKEIKPRVLLFADATKWPSKKTAHAASIVSVARDQLVPRLNAILEAHEKDFTAALSADVALQNLYVFGLVSDISRKLKEYKDENNLMLLADAPKFLQGVIQDSDTPFIYEKVGSFYKNYLIDEFQDTSGLQWKNFLPLLLNSLDQGYTSLVVGDVKQAIYRWRGGDLKLLQSDIEDHMGKNRVDVQNLNSNYRSATSIVNFNNVVFKTAANMVAAETGQPISAVAYDDVAQLISKTYTGFVQVKFLRDEQEGPSWKEQALAAVPMYLEKLQQIGVPLREIAILVRRNDEGQQIIANLLSYKNSGKANPLFKYDVVSNESLRIDSAATVTLLEGALKYLLNPNDDIARAQLAFEFARLHDPTRTYTEVFAVTNQAVFESSLPPSFTKEKSALKKLPLFELTETLIRIFKLGEQTGELSYLQAFQNLVLDFVTRERNDLAAFMEWWEDNKYKKSIPVSGKVEAAQIITIHKSKGLQFRYVILPFCSWSLDHDSLKAPNLWVSSKEFPFGQAGFLPVKYSSTLEHTFFNTYYKEEQTRTYLDNLNLLYVALTRAEQGMIVLAPDPESKNAKKTIAQLLHQSISDADEFSTDWNSVTGEYNTGAWNYEATGKLQEEQNTIQLLHYASANWRDKLVIRHSARNFFETSEDENATRIHYGIHLHAVLSRINYWDEIDSTLKKLLQEGFVHPDEMILLQTQLNELLENEQVKSWFSRPWKVKTEVPLLLPDGNESRIDRLLIDKKHAVVIDFKTGERTQADQQQVTSYMSILRQMNFTEVEGYLLYVKTGEVISVSASKARIIKKKDDAQLDLGI